MARTTIVRKLLYRVFWDRAREFGLQMDRSAAEGAWNSVGLLGVHCVISACDALTVGLSGERWSGQDHGGAVDLIRGLHLANSTALERQVTDVLAMKDKVEYEAREFTRAEAEELRKHASRILSRVKGELGKTYP